MTRLPVDYSSVGASITQRVASPATLLIAISTLGTALPETRLNAADPSLIVQRTDEDLSLAYSLPAGPVGTVTLLQTDDLNAPSDYWSPVNSAPVTDNGSGPFPWNPSPGADAQFFRIRFDSIQIPSRMVYAPPGTFMAGAPASDTNASSIDIPEHLVHVHRGFWISKFEVTQAEFLSLMATNPSAYQGDPQCPVESVTWDEAMEYCARFTAIESSAGRIPPGYVYRLPTEAEWEYACRAGTTTDYSFGDDPSQLTRYAWWGFGDSQGHTHPVGQKLPNPLGLYDMHGNVFELCLDWIQAYPGGTPYIGDPRRVARGGSYYCPSNILRSWNRTHSEPQDARSNLHGFRLVLGSTIDLTP